MFDAGITSRVRVTARTAPRRCRATAPSLPRARSPTGSRRPPSARCGADRRRLPAPPARGGRGADLPARPPGVWRTRRWRERGRAGLPALPWAHRSPDGRTPRQGESPVRTSREDPAPGRANLRLGGAGLSAGFCVASRDANSASTSALGSLPGAGFVGRASRRTSSPALWIVTDSCFFPSSNFVETRAASAAPAGSASTNDSALRFATLLARSSIFDVVHGGGRLDLRPLLRPRPSRCPSSSRRRASPPPRAISSRVPVKARKPKTSFIR